MLRLPVDADVIDSIAHILWVTYVSDTFLVLPQSVVPTL